MKSRIREERLNKNLTQIDLASLVNVSRQSIIALEMGKYIPTTILALKIAKVFNKPVEEIFILEKSD